MECPTCRERLSPIKHNKTSVYDKELLLWFCSEKCRVEYLRRRAERQRKEAKEKRQPKLDNWGWEID